ncbi:cbb3-type cytochrome c oxidase subunit I, partial [Streptomyces sp. BE282]|uniref:cbb3-type cytochrome c oxidase subunit I n=1 Tax=Streptomyces sp. BE282 TaxID=3002527 RepID=UPI002E767A61
PGMTMFRMPIFTWNVLLTGVLVLLAFPVRAAALVAREAERTYGAQICDSPTGGALLCPHLFWFFAHPEVYINALPGHAVRVLLLRRPQGARPAPRAAAVAEERARRDQVERTDRL